jgi:hypothetical protein
MRGDGGYAGPIVHWWESCWLYTGPMIDWRYEGIICGYLELFRATVDGGWLERARQAGDDVVKAQAPDGHFGNSSFQHGPQSGGTPHEAAVDVGLLALSQAMRERGMTGWEVYAEAAERNIERYLLAQLWTGHGFADQPWHPVLVPNKNATIIEALLRSESVSGRRVMDFVQPAAEVILSNQVTAPGVRRGATIHTGTGQHTLAITIYTARCLGALLRLNERTGEHRYRQAALEAGRFLARQVTPRGTRFGYYRDGRPIGAPQWVSASGDVLRALTMVSAEVEEAEGAARALGRVLVEAQYPTGGIPTAYGFARRGSSREARGAPEFRDVLPVVGWCDKAFRALALLARRPALPSKDQLKSLDIACTWGGERCHYREDGEKMTLIRQSTGKVLYQWRKGAVAPEVYAL